MVLVLLALWANSGDHEGVPTTLTLVIHPTSYMTFKSVTVLRFGCKIGRHSQTFEESSSNRFRRFFLTICDVSRMAS